MLYLKWFGALESLCSNGDNATVIDKETLQGLFFLGNMWMPKETQIIRLGPGTPSDFRGDETLNKRRDLLAEKFFLPTTGVVVEDQMSAIGFVDLKRGQAGVSQQRLFVHIERVHDALKNQTVGSLGTFSQSLVLSLSLPPESLFSVWGIIGDVQNLNIDNNPVVIPMAIWGTAIFDANRVHTSAHSNWFTHYLQRRESPADAKDTAAFTEMVERIGPVLVQNLQFGLLQVAYHNAIIG